MSLTHIQWLGLQQRQQQQQRWSRKLRAHIRRIKGVDFAGRSFQVNLSIAMVVVVVVMMPMYRFVALHSGSEETCAQVGKQTTIEDPSTQFQPASRYVDINKSTTTTKWTKGSKHLFPYSSVVVVFNSSSSSEGYLLLQLTFSLWLRGSCTGEGMWIRNDLAGNVLKNIYSYTHPRVVFQFKRMVLEDLLDARLL